MMAMACGGLLLTGCTAMWLGTKLIIPPEPKRCRAVVNTNSFNQLALNSKIIISGGTLPQPIEIVQQQRSLGMHRPIASWYYVETPCGTGRSVQVTVAREGKTIWSTEVPAHVPRLDEKHGTVEISTTHDAVLMRYFPITGNLPSSHGIGETRKWEHADEAVDIARIVLPSDGDPWR